MRIDSTQPSPIGPDELAGSAASAAKTAADEARSTRTGAAHAGGDYGDDLQLSERALLAHRISTALESKPTVRAELVAQLKAAVANGSYVPNPARIADGLLGVISGRRV